MDKRSHRESVLDNEQVHWVLFPLLVKWAHVAGWPLCPSRTSEIQVLSRVTEPGPTGAATTGGEGEVIAVSGVRQGQSGRLGTHAGADLGHLLARKWTGRSVRPVHSAEFSPRGSSLSDVACTPFSWPWSSRPAYAILLGHDTSVLMSARPVSGGRGCPAAGFGVRPKLPRSPVV